MAETHSPLDGFACRRYLTRFSTRELPLRWIDVLVLGSGVSGLEAALTAAERTSVIVTTKAQAQESSTWWAQGGVAAVLGLDPDDSFEKHIQDTLTAGGSLCDEDVVDLVVREGGDAIRELIDRGANFDKAPDGALSLTREGGHSANRILHAKGDASGQEVERTMLERAREHPRIRFLEHAFVVDLVTAGGECQGALIWDDASGLQFVAARATILATGGAGRVYRETTNPHVATGDGLAMAYRAGAVLKDLEFMQFHPTTLYVAGAARRLLTEALRGEGAYLRDDDGQRFMTDVHELAELAPRDIVSRAIVRKLREQDGRNVYLDLRHLHADKTRARFPGIDLLCKSYGLDLTADLLPVHPSAHYTIGGVEVDEHAQTSVPRLLAVGEVSCSGLHGANRLASNSLLEGMVFGKRAGAKAADLAEESLGGVAHLALAQSAYRPQKRVEIDIEDVLNAMRTQMWRRLGVERDPERMAELERRLSFWASYVLDEVFAGPRGWELQNQLTVAMLMTQSARWREDSRGTHYRGDFPEARPEYELHCRMRRPSTTSSTAPEEATAP